MVTPVELVCFSIFGTLEEGVALSLDPNLWNISGFAMEDGYSLVAFGVIELANYCCILPLCSWME